MRPSAPALAAVLLVATEAAIALAGGSSPLLAVAVLMVAPGLALLRLLPRRVAAAPSAALAAVPALGFAASSVLLVTLAAVGVALDGTSVRIALLALVVLGCVLPPRDPGERGWERGEGLALLGLAGGVAVAVLLQERVIGGWPVPGNDWAKYVLYADEIRASGSLLIDNPYWLLGVPFREDPAAPAVYGAYLALTGHAAAVVAHGIWLFAVATIASAYALVRSQWGRTAGVAAAWLWAVLPISHDILGWHGLANQAALVLLPVVLLYAAEFLRGGGGPWMAVGFGLLLAALFASHRLSAAVALGAIALAAPVAVLWGGGWRALRWPAAGLGAAAVLGAGVVYDLYERNRTFGGTQGYEAYLSQKITWDLVARDFTYAFSAVAVAAAVWLAYAAARRRARLRNAIGLVPIAATLLVTLALGYAWIVHFPVAYVRMVYYLPLAMVPFVAVALAALPRRWAWGATVALCVAVFVPAWDQAPNVRSPYAFTSPAALRGLDALERQLAPDEVVVTDRCWSFLGTWLLRTRTLPALTPADIQPKAEVRLAELGREVLAGTPDGRRIARQYGVRYLLLDPTCRDDEREFLRPPLFADPVYASKRLVIARIRE